MVHEAKYLAWNCELKTRLSDIVSHLRNDCRQIVTQQLQKSFSTMPTACKFSEMPLFIYLSLRLLDIGFRVQFNAEFPRQVMNCPIIFYEQLTVEMMKLYNFIRSHFCTPGAFPIRVLRFLFRVVF